MTDISLKRGDTVEYAITIFEADGITPVDLTDSIIKMAVKRRQDDRNDAALIFKTSYDITEIDITDPVNGKCTVFFYVSDTEGLMTGDFCYDIEVNRRDAVRTILGTIDVTTGSVIMDGTGLVMANISVGDILIPAGIAAANQVAVTIQEVEEDAGPGNLRTDYTGFVTEPGITIQVLRANRKTPVGLSGRFTIVADVVT